MSATFAVVVARSVSASREKSKREKASVLAHEPRGTSDLIRSLPARLPGARRGSCCYHKKRKRLSALTGKGDPTLSLLIITPADAVVFDL